MDDNIYKYIYIYIVIHRQTVSLYHNSSMWLDRIPEWLIRSKSFVLYERQPKIPSAECSNHIAERIYCQPQTDCFVVSLLIIVARHVGRLKLGSKPAQLYVRFSIRQLGQQAYHVSLGIIRY